MYVPEYGPVDLEKLFEQVQLDAPTDFQQLIDMGFLGAMYELMSEGELVVTAPGVSPRLTAEERHGEIYEKLKPLWNKSLEHPEDSDTKEIQRLGRLIGKILARQIFSGSLMLDNSSMVQPGHRGATAIRIGSDYVRPMPVEPRMKIPSVLDLGAGLLGARFINWQAQRIQSFTAPAQYLPINKGPMQSQFLWDYAAFTFDSIMPDLSKQMIGNMFISREDGMDAFMLEMGTVKSAGMISAVVCNGLSHIPADELDRTLSRTPDLLRAGGAVILGLTVEPLIEGGATFDCGYQTLVDSGLALAHSITEHTGSHLTGHETVSTFGVFVHGS